MTTSSMFLGLTSIRSSLYFLKCSRCHGRRAHSLTLPPGHGTAQLEERHDPRRNRQPEGDHTVGEDRREDDRRRRCRRATNAADHARVHRRPRRPRGDGIRLAAIPTKKPWTSTAERDVASECLEARPQHADVRAPRSRRRRRPRGAPRRGWRMYAIAVRVPIASVAGPVAIRG